MKWIATILGLLSAAFAAVVRRPANSYQGFMVKSTATANSPALVVLGTLAAALGLRLRAPVATLCGVAGAGVGATYIRKVTAAHDEFERALGPDWRHGLSQDTERTMLRRRLTWRLPRVPEPTWTRDVPFWTIPGTSRQLLADIWEPATGVKRPGTVIVYLYGGSWHFFDKDVLTRPFFRQLCAQGHVVMDAAHRSCPETDVFGMVHDVHRAVAWIKANAARYGVDPEKVVTMGGSSGAHIALLAGYATDHPELKPAELGDVDTSVMAVVSWYGIPELESAFEHWLRQAAGAPEAPAVPRPEPGKLSRLLTALVMGRPLTAAQSPPAPPVRALMRNLIGGLPDEVPDRRDLASPVHHVNASCPPTLMFQGTHDAVVPLGAARRLYRALQCAGVPVVYIEYPWTEHAFDLMYPPLANPAARAALYDLERFLAIVTSEAIDREARVLAESEAAAEDLRSLDRGAARVASPV
jgi:acetyl esterase/lipase